MFLLVDDINTYSAVLQLIPFHTVRVDQENKA